LKGVVELPLEVDVQWMAQRCLWEVPGEEGSGGIHFRFFGKSIGVGPPDLLCFLQFWTLLDPCFWEVLGIPDFTPFQSGPL